MAKKNTTKQTPEINPFPIVAIGASVGGLDAISTFLKNIPVNTGMAFIIVQHLSPDHKSFLSSLLSKTTNMAVEVIVDMVKMLPNHVYVIPYNKIIEVTNGHIKLLPRPTNSSLTSIDTLFTSLARTHHQDVIGIVLSGNAKDGAKGLEAIKKEGGITFAQDESAQASSMPESAIATGMVDYILNPEAIAEKIIELGMHAYTEIKEISTIENLDPTDILALVLAKTKVDFSHYKTPTILRRIQHMMHHCEIKTIEKYLGYLSKNESAITELHNDLLINVTHFFRDPEVFEFLTSTILPQLLSQKIAEETFRVWVPACSTGQEAYSIAILINEIQEKNEIKIPVQLFATDLSEKTIRYARLGSFTPAEISSVPEHLIDKYFTKSGENYVIVKNIRETCVFAPHNVLKDPPFSHIDFISCRNLLIYFDQTAQKKVFTSFYFSLVSNGLILLGTAETFGTGSNLFSRVNSKYKVYSKKNKINTHFPETMETQKPLLIKNSTSIVSKPKPTSIQPLELNKEIDRVLLQSHMPASVVIKKDMEIVQFRGPVSNYLTHTSGKASLNLLKMAKPELAFELRNAINSVLKTKNSVKKIGVQLMEGGQIQSVFFEVSMLELEWEEPLLLVVFSTKQTFEFQEEKGVKKASNIQQNKQLQKITDALQFTRSEINSIIEEQEITYEELQTANEEIVSSNEEFQTLNEELETSKEEIEATNEELITSNHELLERHERLTEAHEFSKTIFETIHEPILILDKTFRVKTANKSFYEKFKVKKEETEEHILFELGEKHWNIIELKNKLKAIFQKDDSFENFKVIHTFPEIGEKTMLLNARLIVQKTSTEKLILLAIEDITEQTRFYLQENLVRKKAEEKFKGFLESAPDAIIIADSQGEIQLINSQTEKLFGYDRKELIGKKIEVLLPGRFQMTHTNHRKDFIEKPSTRCMDIGLDLFGLNKKGQEFPVEVSISQLVTEDGILVTAAVRDITEQKRISNELSNAKKIAEDAVMVKQQFLSNMSHEIRTPLNAVIGFTNVLLKTELSAKQTEYLKAIKVSGDTLIVLINDILDLAKVKAGKLIFENLPFNLENSVETMLQIFSSEIQKKNLILDKKFDSKIPKILSGDAIRLNQILLNLISNAVKFTSVGTISVSLHLIKQDSKTATIEFVVQDTGIGISKQNCITIFENFQQATSHTSRIYGGTGLGLAISKQSIESQGGKIKLINKVNKGSTFSFQLKIQKNSETICEKKQLEVDKKLTHLRVLVAEDVPMNQLLIRTILEEFGVQQVIVNNGLEVIEKLSNDTFDLILMDLQMPIMNGYETTTYIRKTLKSTIPIIALSADVSNSDLEKCKLIGTNAHVAKPIDEQVLYQKMMNVLEIQVPIKIKQKTRKSTVNLDRLYEQTNSNPVLILEMISLYIEQAPTLIAALQEGLTKQDWELIHAAAHKLIPTFAIMGIERKYETKAKKLAVLASTKTQLHLLPKLINELITICEASCEDSKWMYQKIKTENAP